MITEQIQQDLRVIIEHFQQEDIAARERQLRYFKKLEYFWNGFTRVWWSDTAHDWRVWDREIDYNISSDQSYYDKPVNIYKAFLETIIAAMSSTVPPVKCIPDDANNMLDVSTANGGDKIAELIYKHNDAPLLWVQALYVYCLQGMLVGYNYSCEDKNFGTIKEEKFEDQEIEEVNKICPNCKSNLITTEDIDLALNERTEYDPDDNDALGHSQVMCSQCQMMVDPELNTTKVIIKRFIGYNETPKSRQHIKVLGGVNVKVPLYAREQKECPYLCYSYEEHYSSILARYEELRDKIDTGSQTGEGSGYDLYERWARLNTLYYNDYPLNTPTVRNWWLRPSAFEVLTDEAGRKALHKKFPDGCRVVFINDHFAEAENESLDDHWTIAVNPLSRHIHFDPLATSLTSIQEITNDMISLVLQTIEHGIPQTFADPSVLDFESYRKTEATPGQIIPAKPKSGRSMNDAFYEVKTATLSREVEPFSERIYSLGQFVSGALPSLSGGEMPSSARTAAQYSMSRTQALQRFQTPWKMLTYWWKNVFAKVIPAYIKTMVEDERLVKIQDGNYINVLIERASLDGKIGDVELEASDVLPITIGQEKDIIMSLLQLNNPDVLQALTDPANLPFVAQAIGLTGFHLPGEDDRQKQFEEIQLLINSQPIQTADGQEMTSVMPEFLVDDHKVEGDVTRSWLVGPAGRQCKAKNPEGYKNVLLHLQVHIEMLQQLSMGIPPEQQEPGAIPGQPPQPVGDVNNGVNKRPPARVQ